MVLEEDDEMADEKTLTEKQEAFCQYYAQLSDTYNNGTWSYALAYGYDLESQPKDDNELDDNGHKIPYTSSFDKMSNVCAVGATRLLRIDKIIDRVQAIKSSWIEDDKIVDSRLMDIIVRGKDTDSLAGIKHRNDLKQRVTKQLDVTSGGEPLKTALVQFIGEEDQEKE